MLDSVSKFVNNASRVSSMKDVICPSNRCGELANAVDIQGKPSTKFDVSAKTRAQGIRVFSDVAVVL